MQLRCVPNHNGYGLFPVHLTQYHYSVSPPETSYAHLFITVLDVNDNAPQFDYPFYIFGEQ